MLRQAKKGLLLLACFMLLTLVPGMTFATPEMNELEAVRFTDDFLASASEHLFEGYSAEDVQQVINAGGQIYRDIRVQSDTTGTMTYRIPVSDSEIEYLAGIQEGNIQPFNANPFQRTKIRCSGRPYEDSIVIILLGDGFTAAQYGTWPNPAQNTVLRHADNAVNALLDTHPFGLFSELITVYVIHSVGINPVTNVNGYLGTVAAPGGTPQHGLPGTAIGGEFTSNGFRWDRVDQLARAAVYPYNPTMIQVISNASGGTGFAMMPWHYQLNVNIGATSIRNNTNPIGGSNVVWPNGTAWRGTFIHEFGHSFGKLVDEHEGTRTNYGRLMPATRDERRANSTAATNANIKWRHWAGHRNVLAVPTRFEDGWAVPAAVSGIAGQSGCLMRASWGNRNFCGVCTAELVRRMALISGETFHGRSPTTANPLPNTPTVTLPQGTTRILDSAFHGNTSLQTIHIPASVTTIGDYAFIGATGLRTIISDRIVPQRINDTTFAGLNRANITVNIPFGTTQAYIAAGWSGFRLVEPPISSWQALRDAINSAPAGVPITLQIPSNFSAPTGVAGTAISIPANRHITLISTNTGAGATNIRTLTQTNSNQRHFVLENRSSLTLGQNITLCGGTLPNNTTHRGGVAVNGQFSQLNMLPGSVIQNNRATNGGGVALSLEGRVRMSGGEIRNNTATNMGGGVWLDTMHYHFDLSPAFTMTGGTIRNNTARNGGGVWVAETGAHFFRDPTFWTVLNMSGTSTITGNTAINNGGGIYIGFYEFACIDWITSACCCMLIGDPMFLIPNAINNNHAGNVGNNIYSVR